MGSHFNRAARDDGAQGALMTRAQRRREYLQQHAEENAALADVLSTAELDLARRLAKAATPEIMEQLIDDALSAEKASERTSAAKLVLAVGWGGSMVKPQQPATARQQPGTLTINVLGPRGERPEQVKIIDVGVAPEPGQ